MKKLFLLTSILLIFLTVPGTVSASILSLSPGSGSLGVGGVLAVSVRLNTGGEGVNAVSAFLSYPQDKLGVAYVNAGGAFSIEAEKTYGGGVIKISRGNINPVSGNVTVATVGFKGKTLGSAKVSFISGSAAPRASDSSDSLNLGGSSGGTYNIVAAKAPANSQTAQVSPTPQTAFQQVAARPKISDIKVVNLTANSATIEWKTDKEADAFVEYGLEKDKYFIIAQSADLTVEHSLNLPEQILTPGTKFYFKVSSKDAAGNISRSEEMDFQLPNLVSGEEQKFNLKAFVSDNIIAVLATPVIVGLITITILIIRRRIKKQPEPFG